ncbi:PTS glucose/sucrose transporter subunit IIB, partial [Avibacterium paragallinarum]
MFFNKKENEKPSPYLIEQTKQLLSALGGKTNLIHIDACITRLRLEVKDFSKINEQRLAELGSKGTLKIGENQVHIILGKSADSIAQLLKIFS